MLFLFRLPFLPLKIVLFVARLFGYSRFAVFAIGVAIGLLLAPTTGQELRARLRDLAQGDPPSGTNAVT